MQYFFYALSTHLERNLASFLHTQQHEVNHSARYKMIAKALVAASTKPIILSILISDEDYGYQIIQKVREISGGKLDWSDNMLYPVLRRMEKSGLIISRWKLSDGGRLRRYYQITEEGQKELESDRRQWMSVHQALTKLWKPLPALK